MSDKKTSLNFIMHDAENLEPIISRGTIDYAIDIESNFFYPNKMRFYREISKVLRSDGRFILG